MTPPPRPALRVRVRDVPAINGLRWIRLGWRAFRRQPGGFLGLFAMSLLTAIGLSLPIALVTALVPALQANPVFIQMFGVVLLPLVTLGNMVATEAVTNDLRVRPHMLFMPLGAGPRVRLGIAQIALAYFAVLVLAYFAGNGLDGGEARDWLAALSTAPDPGAPPPSPKPLGDAGTWVLMLKAAIVALGSIPLWHAPALVLWGGQGAAQAMFSSTVGLWHTRGAFAAYVLGGLAVGFASSTALAVLSAILPGFWVFVAIAAAWTLSAVFYTTLWFGFVDTFEIAPLEGDAPAARAE